MRFRVRAPPPLPRLPTALPHRGRVRRPLPGCVCPGWRLRLGGGRGGIGCRIARNRSGALLKVVDQRLAGARVLQDANEGLRIPPGILPGLLLHGRWCLGGTSLLGMSALREGKREKHDEKGDESACSDSAHGNSACEGHRGGRGTGPVG